MVIERIRRYLDEEKFVARTTEEIRREIRELRGAKFAAELFHFLIMSSPGEEFYERLARPVDGMAAYDYLASRQRTLIEKRLEFVCADGVFNGGGRILDMGCASGLDACFIAEQFPQTNVVGIDLSQGMIERAKERAKRRGIKNVEFCAANQYALPFADDSFDLTLPHSLADDYQGIRDMVGRLSEVKRVLHKAGKVIISMESDIGDDPSKVEKYYESAEFEQPFRMKGFGNITHKYIFTKNSDGVDFIEDIITATK